MAAELANDSDSTGSADGRGDTPSGGFIAKIWGSTVYMAVAGLVFFGAASAVAAAMLASLNTVESPQLTASTVAGGSSLSNGQTAQISFKVPKGYSRLIVPIRLNNPRPAGCLATGKVDLRAVSGTVDPAWHAQAAASGVVVQLVEIEKSSELVVVSAGLTTPGDCRTDMQVLSYRTMDTPGELGDVESVVVESTVVLLTVLTAVFGFRALWLGTSRSRRERSPDWEPRVRLRVAEDRLVENLRQQPGPDDSSDHLGLSRLWDVNYARLDLYHRIATGQASESFRNAQIAMGLGFVLLIGFTVGAILARSSTASVVAGALGVTSAALAGYVSRTFVRSQESAASHLHAYFDQPLEFSRFLAAERLIADADLTGEQRAEILASLARAMVTSSPSSGATPDAATPTEPSRNRAADQAEAN